MDFELYQQLGVKPAINAMGNVTLLGGSILSPAVRAAMEASNDVFVPVEDLLDKSGQAIARMLGAESAYVTSGAYSALVQGISGIITGGDAAKIARMPDTAGMKREFLIQKKTRYHYDRCVTAAGGVLVEVGDDTGTTRAQLEEAIGPNTAAIFYYARAESLPGVIGIAETVKIAQAHGIAVIVDAAGEIYPLERMRWLPSCGADVVCFGAKYLGAANSSGILCGRTAPVAAARLNGFMSYEALKNRSPGRGYKIDRQEIVGAWIALREWLDMDHEERLQTQATRIDAIIGGLADLPHVKARNIWDEEGGAWMRLRIELNSASLGKGATEVAEALKAGEPSIWVRVEGDDLVLAVHTLREGETEMVRDGLRRALAPVHA